MFEFPSEEKHGTDPAVVFARLVEECDEFSHLREGNPEVRWLLRGSAVIRAGRMVLGTTYLPSVQGALKPLFDWMLHNLLGCRPDFLVVLDSTWWMEATEKQREILVFHEACHMGQAVDAMGVPRFSKDTGAPIWAIVGHTVEEFSDVVRRYGAWSPDLVEFLDAAGEFRN